MADSNEKILIDIQVDTQQVQQNLSAAVQSLQAMKEEQKRLTKEIEAGNDANGEMARQLAQVKNTIDQNNRVIRSHTALLQAENGIIYDTNASLDDQRQQLKQLQNLYGSLSGDAKKAADAEGGLRDQIKQVAENVKEQEAAMGDNRRNVGNYPKFLQPAINALGKFGVSLDDLAVNGTKSFAQVGKSAKAMGKTLITPPVGIITVILSAIVLAIQKVTAAFKKNDDAMTNLQKAFAIFEPILSGIGKAFTKLAETIGKAAAAIADFAVKVASKLSKSYADAAQEAQALVQAQDDLEEAERQYTVNSATRAREISRLREEATSTTDLEKRKQLLQQAIDLEKADLEDRKKIADEKLRIAEATAKKENDTSDATKDEIARLRAEAIKADQEYYDNTRKLQGQITAIEQQQQKARTDAANKTAAERKAIREGELKNAEDVERLMADFAVSMIEDETARTIAERKLAGEREIAVLQKRLDTEKNMTSETRDQLAELIKGKQAALDAELLKMADDAAEEKTQAEYEREQQHAREVLNYRLELAQENTAEELEARKALLDMEMQQALDATTLNEEEKFLIRQAFAERAAQLDKEYNERLIAQAQDARDAYKQTLLQTAQNASKSFGAMSSLLEKYSEQSEQAAAAQKVFGMTQIITDQAVSIANTAKAITEAVAGATQAAAAGGPAAPFLLAGYIAGMVGAVVGAVASVASSIASAKQLMAGDAGNFATGGFIGGTSYTGDRVIAHTNSGEAVLTPQQQRTFMDMANGRAGGFDYAALADVMVAAVAAQPAPVMDYQEFKQFERQTATFNEIVRI